MIVAVPAEVAVKVTEHVALTSVQLAGVNEPVTPATVKLTEPPGVNPAPTVSVMVTVQVGAGDDCPTTMGVVQVTLVLVVLALDTTEPVPLLVPCIESPL